MYLIIFILGLIIGSFLNVCICRIPEGTSIFTPPSHCPKCNTFLKSKDLVPLLSYMIFRGKCQYCRSAISIKYPLVELINGLLYVALYMEYGNTIDFLQYATLISVLVVITYIDYEYYIIPDGVILFGFIVATLFNMVFYLENVTVLKSDILGFLVGGGLFLFIAIVTKGAMGGGDIKLMALLGFWLGLPWTLLIILLAFVLGGILSIALIAFKIKSRKDMIPFGPFIAAATVITVFWGNKIIDYYMHTLTF